MPITVYTGLMRSGKSYEVVSEVILSAIAEGRRVVTNVDGISNDLIRSYVAEKKKLDIAVLGTILHVTNDDVFRADFLPHYDDAKDAHTDTKVQPGDLVCIDEAWRFWGTDCKLLKEHKSFFLEHGHFTHPGTGVACDLVLMIQDMGTLHRFVKNVVAFNFRTHKKVALGFGNTYSVTCWEGYKQGKQTRISESVRTYKKEIFPLYASFKGGAAGKTVNVDKRQNIFAGPKIWMIAVTLVVIGIWSFYKIYVFFNPPQAINLNEAQKKIPPASIPVSVPSKPVQREFSKKWRIAGDINIEGRQYVLLANEIGALRAESPSMFNNVGLARTGETDGDRVAYWSGEQMALQRPASPSSQTTIATPFPMQEKK